jgi:hypothetical protein
MESALIGKMELVRESIVDSVMAPVTQTNNVVGSVINGRRRGRAGLAPRAVSAIMVEVL